MGWVFEPSVDAISVLAFIVAVVMDPEPARVSKPSVFASENSGGNVTFCVVLVLLGISVAVSLQREGNNIIQWGYLGLNKMSNVYIAQLLLRMTLFQNSHLELQLIN